MQEDRPCELCGGTKRVPRYHFDGIRVLKCEACGLVFGRPDRAVNARELYDIRYFRDRESYFSPIPADDAPCASGGGAAAGFREGLRLIGSYRAPGRLLDVGCATGAFLSMARAEGWDVAGVDVSEYASSLARSRLGGSVYTGELADAGFPDSHFDVVTLWDVVEHLEHPGEVLSEARRILAADGILFLDTPNEEALIRRVAFMLHRMLCGRVAYPASKLYHMFHLYYFSEKTLLRLLGESGFEVVRVERRPIPREKGRGSGLERTLVKAFSLLERPLGMDFELLVVARKKKQTRAGRFQPAREAQPPPPPGRSSPRPGEPLMRNGPPGDEPLFKRSLQREPRKPGAPGACRNTP